MTLVGKVDCRSRFNYVWPLYDAWHANASVHTAHRFASYKSTHKNLLI
jgi:hypothetical protein